MEDLVFAINVVFPIVLIIGLGYFIKRIGLLTKEAFNALNKLCFKVLLPISLFMNIYDSSSITDFNYVLPLFIVVSLMLIFIFGLFLVKIFIHEDTKKGVILQGLFRSNYAIIGIPLAYAIAGEQGRSIATFIALITIPIFNILATIALTIFIHNDEKNSVLKTIKKILTNPLILGVLLGLIFLLIRMLFDNLEISFRLKNIGFIYTTLKQISNITTPLALLTLGGLFEFSKIKEMKRLIAFSVLSRLVILPMIIFLIAILLFDFNSAEYATMIAVFASPVAVSSAIMAKEMNNDGDLANQIVVWTTLLSSITIFVIIIIFKVMEIL